MQTLRNAHRLARFVLVWFVMSIGVAIASPLVKPQATAVICSGGGAMTILAMTDDSSEDAAQHTLKCPLCMPVSAPAPAVHLQADPMQPLGYALQSVASAHIAALTAAPPPARGPPGFS